MIQAMRDSNDKDKDDVKSLINWPLTLKKYIFFLKSKYIFFLIVGQVTFVSPCPLILNIDVQSEDLDKRQPYKYEVTLKLWETLGKPCNRWRDQSNLLLEK